MASAKGGSGKTILTATFSAFLAETKNSVLILDCDESTNGMSLLYLDQISKFDIYSKKLNFGVFDRSETDNYAKVKISEGVDIIPATFHLLADGFVDETQFESRISYIIDEEKSQYDYIFLDSQAGLDTVSKVTMNSNISDMVVIVSEYDPLSNAGVERLKAAMGPHLNSTRTWVLLNKMLPEFVKSFSEFLSVARYATNSLDSRCSSCVFEETSCGRFLIWKRIYIVDVSNLKRNASRRSR